MKYYINREAPKISALSLGKTDKNEYLTDEEIITLNQTRIIQKARFTYFPLAKEFEKNLETIKIKGKTKKSD